MKNSQCNYFQSGNVILTLFAAIAAVGVVGATSMTVMKGPVRGMHQVTQKTIAENNMIASIKLAIMATAHQPNNGDCDSDNTVEPIAWSNTGTGPHPTGGGYLPASIGASLQDPWGNTYGYCVWDHGSTIQSTCPTPTQRLRGAGVGGSGPVIAIISSGPDRTFQTSCANAPTYINKVSGSDDIVLSYTYAEASSLSGGIWNLKSSDLNTAEINKNLEVKNASNTVVFGVDSTSDINRPSIKVDYIKSLSNPRVEMLSPLTVTGVITGTSFTGIGTNLTALNASNLTSGTVPVARVSGSYTGIVGTGALNAGSITSGFGNINIGTATFTGDGSGLTNLNASNLSTGRVAAARLGTGTANVNTVLRGNGTWGAEQDPSVGAVTNGKWCRGNGTAVVCDQDEPSGGGTSTYQVFTASGTWTKPAGANMVMAECWGGGGGGRTSASGGGGGAYSRIQVTAASLPATVTVTVGAGGTRGNGGYTSAGNGGNGGNSSFGAYLVAQGGGGGTAVNCSYQGGSDTAPPIGGGVSGSIVPITFERGGDPGGNASNSGDSGSCERSWPARDVTIAGAAGSPNTFANTSAFGGNGGTTGAGGVRGGGGGGRGTGGAGGRGECRVTTW